MPGDVLEAPGSPERTPGSILVRFLLPGRRSRGRFLVAFGPRTLPLTGTLLIQTPNYRSQFRTDLFRSETLSIQTSADLSYSVQSRPSVIGLTVPWPHLGQIGPSALILVPKTRLGAGPMSPRVKNKFLDQNSGSNFSIAFLDRIS